MSQVSTRRVGSLAWAILFWMALISLAVEPTVQLWHWLVDRDLPPMVTVAIFGVLEFAVVFGVAVVAVLAGAFLMKGVAALEQRQTDRSV